MQNVLELIDRQIEWTEKQILAELTANHCPPKPENSSTNKLQWRGDIIELVELIYALKESGCFGDTSLKTLFAVIGKAFGCEITDYYLRFWQLGNRSRGERTFFLNRRIKALSDKLIRKDSGKRS